MSWLKFSLVLSTGVLLVGISSRIAMSQDAPPPRDCDIAWNDGPPTGGPEQGRPPRPQGGERRAMPPRGNEDGPPGPPEMRGGPDGDRPQPPRGERRPLRPGEDRDRRPPQEGPGGPGENGPPPGGPEGDRPQPSGMQPGSPMRGREDFEMLKTRDPELFKAIQADHDLERQTHDQAEQYRRASKDEQANIKEKLVEIVSKHFEVRQQLRNLEVKRIEQQMKLLRDKIEQRAKNRKEIVEKRIIELTGADEGERF